VSEERRTSPWRTAFKADLGEIKSSRKIAKTKQSCLSNSAAKKKRNGRENLGYGERCDLKIDTSYFAEEDWDAETLPRQRS